MPLEKDIKNILEMENKDSFKYNEQNLDQSTTASIKCKSNKVSDINRIEQKKIRKIQFANEVKVNNSPNNSYTLDIDTQDNNIETETLGYTIEDIDEKSVKCDNENNITENTSDEASKVKKSVQLPRERVIDMSHEDQKKWEMEEMMKPIDLEKAQVHIDPSPFQLVERTSILKVHSLFSMVGINHAYVTKIGRLVGVVGLKELRKAIEDINSNSFVPPNRDEAEDLDAKPTVEKPLLSPTSIGGSDKAVDMTITSMDSALSNSDNCSDIEMESISKSIEKTPSLPLETTTIDTQKEKL